MSGGPRKFSEKIALLNQKTAEGNAAFDSIMGEVKSIKGSDLPEPVIHPEKSLHSTRLDDVALVGQEYASNKVAYEHKQHKHKKEDHHHTNQHLNKNNNIQINQLQHGINNTNNSYLQLPGQNDSFRRAHSDSSLNHSTAGPPPVTNTTNNFNFPNNNGNNIPPNYNNQSSYVQFQQQQPPQQQQQQSAVYQGTEYQNQTYYANNNNGTNGLVGEFNTTNGLNKHLPLHLSHSNSNGSSNVNSNSSASPSPTSATPNTTNTQHNLPFSSSNNNKNYPLKLPIDPGLPQQQQQQQQQQQSYLQPKFIKNEQVISNNYTLDQQQQQQLQSSSQTTSPVSPTFMYSPVSNNNNYQMQTLQYQNTFQPNNNGVMTNTNLLNANAHISTGGSLPDLTAFHNQTGHLNQNHIQNTTGVNNNHTQVHYTTSSQNHPNHLRLPIMDYPLQHHQQQQQQQHMHQYHMSPQNNQMQQYDLSSQLLPPNFQQHSHVGPVKSTSVSPTRGMSRYSPTNSSSNLSAISNRRPSPQRGQRSQVVSPTGTSQTTPTSPLHPSMHNFPALEFTINPHQANVYMTAGNTPSLGLIYRNGVGANGESLPPSPQSQHSCINSPQGSPGPLSISPQDLNPFTINTNPNYDLMHQKFDSINLETNGQLNYGQQYNTANIALMQQQHQQQQQSPTMMMSNSLQSPGGSSQSNQSELIQQNCNELGKNNSTNGLIQQPDGSNSMSDDLIGSNPASNGANMINNSRSGSISSSGSSCNQPTNSNGLFDEIDYSLAGMHQQNKGLDGENMGPNKTHKKSVPNIILTLTGDIEESQADYSNLNEIYLPGTLDLQEVLPDNMDHTMNNLSGYN